MEGRKELFGTPCILRLELGLADTDRRGLYEGRGRVFNGWGMEKDWHRITALYRKTRKAD